MLFENGTNRPRVCSIATNLQFVKKKKNVVWLKHNKATHNKTGYACNWDFPAGSVVKNLPANAGDTVSIPGLGRSPGGGNGNPLRYSCLENFHGQRSLEGYSPWGYKRIGHS